MKKQEKQRKKEKIDEIIKNRIARNKGNLYVLKYVKNEICHISHVYCIIYIDGALF